MGLEQESPIRYTTWANAGGISQQHEHGYKNGRKDIPFGRAAGHDKIYQDCQQNHTKDQRDPRKARILQGIGCIDSNDHPQIGIPKHGNELGNDKHKDNIPRQRPQGICHHDRDLIHIFDGTHRFTIDNASQHKIEDQDGNQPIDEGGIDEATTLPAQQAVFRHQAQQQEEQEKIVNKPVFRKPLLSISVICRSSAFSVPWYTPSRGVMIWSFTKTPTAVSVKQEIIIKYQLIAGVSVTEGSIS